MAKANITTNPIPVSRSSAGLRDAIFDEIDAIRDGTGNPTRANAVAKLAAGIVETVRMELEVQRFAASAAASSPYHRSASYIRSRSHNAHWHSAPSEITLHCPPRFCRTNARSRQPGRCSFSVSSIRMGSNRPFQRDRCAAPELQR